jgi:3-phenylpropionate/trans-cinnamate dioxygenase ferredoxin component
MKLKVCEAQDLAPGGVVTVAVDPPIAVYNVGGELYAIDDICTHAEYTLSDGYIDEDEVECGLHGARFCIRTGEVRCLPATQNLATHAVVVEEGTVYVEVDVED